MISKCLHIVFVVGATSIAPITGARDINLNEARILVAEKPSSQTDAVAARMFQEEAQKRTGLKWAISSAYDTHKPTIALVTASVNDLAGLKVPPLSGVKSEGYRICVAQGPGPIVWVVGADARGVLFGVGRLLRLLDWSPGRASLADTTDITASPAFPIRGHQLGYRARANSYDAWTPAVYEQYIRDLILFGTNCIENIPFEDD